MTTPVQQPLVKIQDLNKYAMFTDAPGNPGKRSRLVWGIRDGNPRISVFTNVDSDTVKAPLYAGMNPETFFIFLNNFEKVIGGSAMDQKLKIDCLGNRRDKDGNMTQEKYLVSELYYGKDANGICWIALNSEGRPRVKFEFRVSDFHKLYHSNGDQMSEAECSCLQAMATIRALRDTYYTLTGGLRESTEGFKSNGNGSSSGETKNYYQAKQESKPSVPFADEDVNY